MARFAVGVDGGQSSTLAVVVDAAGRVLGAGKAGPSNHITEPGGPERCRRAVADSVAAAVKAAGLTLGDVAYVLCGMTGAFPATREAVARALPDTSHHMVHDSVTAFHGATGGRAGAIVIGGTGSVGYGEDGAGNSLRLGGWGYLMGDEGSAYWIALQAVRGIAAAYDGRAPKTALLRLLPEAVGAEDIRAFHTWLYGQESRSHVAALSKAVDEAAEAGDAMALSILAAAGRELGDLDVAVLERLGMGTGTPRVSYVGGVFRSRTVLSSFEAYVKERNPKADVAPPLLPPIGGAALLALRKLAGAVGDEHIDRLRTGLAAGGIEG